MSERQTLTFDGTPGSDPRTNALSAASTDGFRRGSRVRAMAQSVLVADDDDDVRSLVVLQLTMSGYEPIEAATVDEALRLLADATPPTSSSQT